MEENLPQQVSQKCLDITHSHDDCSPDIDPADELEIKVTCDGRHNSHKIPLMLKGLCFLTMVYCHSEVSIVSHQMLFKIKRTYHNNN